MQKRTSLMAVVFALVVLLVGTSSMFAQEPCSDVQPESCVICHSGAGDDHQAIYDDYADASAFEVTIDSVASVDKGDGTFDVTMTFTIMKDGLPYIDADELPSLDQMRAYAVEYDSATGTFDNDHRLSRNGAGVVALGSGQYSVTSTMAYAPEASNALVYIYIADRLLDTEGMRLYGDVNNAGKAYGTLATTPYVSPANVAGCEKCHGAPYMKHGYRAAVVPGLDDFAACKTCHYDTRNGGHEDWQILVDNPARYAELHAGAEMTPEEEAQYAYTANVMNDVHMSHAMEFPYPQSMANCVTCHEGKLDVVLSDANFKVETCKSCHPVTGSEEYGTAELALATILPHSIEMGVCSNCHTSGGMASAFSEIHTGYDKQVYTADGVKYSNAIVISIDDASVADNKITIRFSAIEDPNLEGIDVADIAPTVMVGMYGWDTKDFIIGPHERLVDDNGDGEIARGDDRALEYDVGDEHPRATTVSAADGAWEVVMDMSTWADLITDGTVKRVEIAVTSELEIFPDGVEADGVELAINASSRTFDLASNDFDDDYYGDIVDIEGCNTCHEALGTTFHGPDRGGSIVTCRMCHITKSRGSHLEMQSRSIDSYIHAIHSFQAFDIGDVNFADPVEAVHYDLHVEHTMPMFTIKNCEACHNEGTYNVPDQSKSLPGAISASDSPLEGWDRNIGDVPLYITGPGSRACGACHRAGLINEDEAGELISFNQHTKNGGYLIEGGDDYTVTLGEVIDYIMALFE